MKIRWNPWAIVTALVALLILKVNISIVTNFSNYFPPDFNSEFLAGRQTYFFGTYQSAFFTHIVSGPLALLFGQLLISTRFRNAYPLWHRRLGRVQAIIVLCFVVPSGLWMACYAASGPIASVSFGILSIATGFTIAMGWKRVLQGRIDLHRRWMLRNFTLLCSAVVLRLVVGAALVVNFAPPGFDILAAWACWVVPLVLLEIKLGGWRLTPLEIDHALSPRSRQ